MLCVEKYLPYLRPGSEDPSRASAGGALAMVLSIEQPDQSDERAHASGGAAPQGSSESTPCGSRFTAARKSFQALVRPVSA
jgi:hypothetical protein